MKIRRNNLTLIELLVVMGLATLLMTIAIPSFQKMLKGNVVNQATSQLKLGLERARAEAISSRRCVALILPNGLDIDSWKEDREKGAILGGYRSAYVQRNLDDGKWTFLEWVPNEEWIPAHENAHVVLVADTEKEVKKIIEKFSNSANKPDSSSKPDSDNKIDISEEKDKNEIIKAEKKSFVEIDKYEGKDNQCAIIFTPYGSIRGAKDIYLMVIESKLDDKELNILSFNNFFILKINHLNGLVEYY